MHAFQTLEIKRATCVNVREQQCSLIATKDNDFYNVNIISYQRQ
jgi:hypothetical protein